MPAGATSWLRWGLTLPFAGVPLAAHEPLVRRAEAAGYDDLWTGETNGSDGFTPLALAAAWTERIRLGTGVVNPFTRGPAVLAQHAAALADASGGRFVLGLGASSDVIVERWNQRPFEKPLSRTCVRGFENSRWFQRSTITSDEEPIPSTKRPPLASASAAAC